MEPPCALDVDLDSVERVCEREEPERAGTREEGLEDAPVRDRVRTRAAELGALELFEDRGIAHHDSILPRTSGTSCRPG